MKSNLLYHFKLTCYVIISLETKKNYMFYAYSSVIIQTTALQSAHVDLAGFQDVDPGEKRENQEPDHGQADTGNIGTPR